MGKRISTARAQSELPQLVAELEQGGEPVIIERDGRAVAALVRPADMRLTTAADGEPKRGALALVGLWRDIPDDEIDSFVRGVYAARASDAGRPVDLSA